MNPLSAARIDVLAASLAYADANAAYLAAYMALRARAMCPYTPLAAQCPEAFEREVDPKLEAMNEARDAMCEAAKRLHALTVGEEQEAAE